MRADFSKYQDTQLLELLAGDSEPALQELYDRYWESLFTKAYNFLRSGDAAKDCVQEVFIWLWGHRRSVHIDHVNNYLHQATRFQALKALREDKTAVGFEGRLTHLTERILASDAIEYKELKAYLENLVNALPEDQRIIFKMHREQSLTYSQIAEKLGISVKSVEKKMSQSLRFLRAQVDERIILLLIFLPVGVG